MGFLKSRTKCAIPKKSNQRMLLHSPNVTTMTLFVMCLMATPSIALYKPPTADDVNAVMEELTDEFVMLRQEEMDWADGTLSLKSVIDRAKHNLQWKRLGRAPGTTSDKIIR